MNLLSVTFNLGQTGFFAAALVTTAWFPVGATGQRLTKLNPKVS